MTPLSPSSLPPSPSPGVFLLHALCLLARLLSFSPRRLLWGTSLGGLWLLSTCIPPAPPDLRGARCHLDEECLAKLVCCEGICALRCCQQHEDCHDLPPRGTLFCFQKRCVSRCSPKDNGCECNEGETRLCGSFVGECSQGLQRCKFGQWGECKGGIEPSEEVCDDRRDNNCNGQIDEGCECVRGEVQPCYSGSTQTLGLGRCRSGVRLCQNGQWGSCIDEVTPTPESCNSQDDDCDGNIDEDIENAPFCSLQGVCVGGFQICQNGRWAGCNSPGYETKERSCDDGKDNDCDGKTDRNDTDCQGSTGCQDGEIRSCYTGSPETQNQGNCRDGRQICNKGVWQPRCDGEILPQKEQCNGRDDNCNGQIDDLAPSSPQPCTLPQAKGRCAQGLTACVSGRLVCRAAYEAAPQEWCNGRDDNCNGQTDESLTCHVASADNNSLLLWNLTTKQKISSLPVQGKVQALAFHPQKPLLAVASDQGLTLWDTSQASLQQTLSTSAATCVRFSCDGNILLSAFKSRREAPRLQAWKTNTGKEALKIQAPFYLYELALTPDDSQIALGQNGDIYLYRVSSGDRSRTFIGHRFDVSALIFTPDGQFLLSGSSDRYLRMWYTATGALFKTFPRLNHPITALSLSSDGLSLATATYSRKIFLWDLNTHKKKQTFLLPKGTARGALLLPGDSQALLSWSSEPTIHLWDIRTGQLLHEYSLHSSSLRALAFRQHNNK